MKNNRVPHEAVWSLILAGGEGIRLKPFIQRWMGRDIPKQYCAFLGNRSMLQHTLDRADHVSQPAHKVTIIARTHQEEAFKHFDGCSGRVVVQPSNLGTVPGIFLPLTYIRASNPNAIVAIFPSDHFIYPLKEFTNAIDAAVSAIKQMPKMMLLVGVEPDSAETDYGWILPGSRLGEVEGYSIRTVRSFLEKPHMEECLTAMAHGARWNTLIGIATVQTLWDLGKCFFPDMLMLFERFQRAIDTTREWSVLEDMYRHILPKNFSADLLQQVPERLALFELQRVTWSDWGRPERILQTLHQLGQIPAFPPELASRDDSTAFPTPIPTGSFA